MSDKQTRKESRSVRASQICPLRRSARIQSRTARQSSVPATSPIPSSVATRSPIPSAVATRSPIPSAVPATSLEPSAVLATSLEQSAVPATSLEQSAVPATSLEHSVVPATSLEQSASPATSPRPSESASPARSFSSSGSSELPLSSIEAKVQSLITLVHNSYTTTLPPDFIPNPIVVDSLQASPLFPLIESMKSLKVDKDGYLNANMDALKLPLSKLVIRKSYIRLAELIIKKFSEPGDMKSLLIGSPGTGKSMFLIFLLYIFVNSENVPILIDFCDMKGFYYNGQFYDYESTMKFYSKSGIKAFNPIFIYDGKSEPLNLPLSPTIVASSPRIDRYRDYRKEKTIFLMPLWKRAEIIRLNSCQTLRERQLTDSELADRFEYAGGVPRVIFLNPRNWEKYRQAVKLAVDDLEPSILAREGEGAIERGPHTVIGVRVDTRNYEFFECCFLSQKIWTEALETLIAKNENLIEYVFSKLESLHSTGLLHKAFQYLAMKRLCDAQLLSLEPINDIAKNLFGNNIMELRLQKASKKVINSLDNVDVNYPEPRMWVPTSDGFPVVDYIFTQPAPPNSLDRNPLVIGFQMTVSSKHPINHACLQRLVDKFRGRLILVFALPRTVYSKFKKQNQVVGSNGEKCAENLILPMAQFKICSFVDLFPLE